MDLHLSPELVDKLTAAASRRGVSAEALAHETLERALDYDDWFVREVDSGLAQVDANRTIDDDAMGARLAKKFAELDPGR